MVGDAPAQGWDVFISYSGKDSDRVTEVVTHLRQHDLRVWFFPDSVLPGTRMRHAILDGIKRSAVVVVFLSQHSLSSEWVLNELDTAMMRELNEKRLIVVPVLLGRLREEDVPGDLKGKYYIDLRHHFERRWAEEKVNFTMNLIALAKGQATAGDVVVVEVGDPLIRYLATYRFKYRSQSSKVEERMMAKVARSFGVVAAGRHGAKDDEDAPPITDDDLSARRRKSEAQRWQGYPESTRRFVQRYGEYALQQLTLFYLDRLGLDLTGGFSHEGLGQLFGDMEVILNSFEIQFAFEDLRADDSHHLLMRIERDGVFLQMVGDVTIT